VGQVLWDIGPQATTADIVCLLQTRFGTQLQAKHLKAQLCARRRTEASLVTLVGKEDFIAALSDGRLHLVVMKGEPPNVEAIAFLGVSGHTSNRRQLS